MSWADLVRGGLYPGVDAEARKKVWGVDREVSMHERLVFPAGEGGKM